MADSKPHSNPAVGAGIQRLAEEWYAIAMPAEDSARIAAMTDPTRQSAEAVITKIGTLDIEPAHFQYVQRQKGPAT